MNAAIIVERNVVRSMRRQVPANRSCIDIVEVFRTALPLFHRAPIFFCRSTAKKRRGHVAQFGNDLCTRGNALYRLNEKRSSDGRGAAFFGNGVDDQVVLHGRFSYNQPIRWFDRFRRFHSFAIDVDAASSNSINCELTGFEKAGRP